MTKKRSRPTPARAPRPSRLVVPPPPPAADEADRQEVYDRSVSEFETDGVRDAETASEERVPSGERGRGNRRSASKGDGK